MTVNKKIFQEEHSHEMAFDVKQDVITMLSILFPSFTVHCMISWNITTQAG